MKPHLVKGWLNPKIDDMEAFAEQTRRISKLYQSAKQLLEQGIHVYSTDEKSGIQAREHKNPKHSMEAGRPERLDPEYIRHGTTGMIASFAVATGEIVAPMIRKNRKEEDFAEHIADVVARKPQNQYLFVLDNLNIHKSEALVRYIAKMEGIAQEELGQKQRTGILHTMASREAFLTDPTHRIRLIYTPKHCSWLNQIEFWFGIITRRLLNRRASFVSIEDLEIRIKAFIEFYNQYLKKAFQWNYKGKILKV